ncbi:MAG TPA: DUF4268 domain-containing protein [Gemmatimonadaceae bacterium]|jgi:hypothetical protein
MAITVGELQVLNPRDLWKHEERDFTPWLAQNISHLSDLIGFPIAVDQIEHKVGAYELDILGHVEDTETIVVIENQLTQTDHAHLGQLLAYAAGLDAGMVIWVAADIRDEHRTTIEWLNAHAGERVSFFLVRPEVVRIDDSKPAVRFQLEVGPSEFSRRLQEVASEGEAARHDFRLTFWEGFLSHLVTHGCTWASGRSSTKDAWLAFGVGRSGIGGHVSMATGSRIRVEIYCSQDADKAQFEELSRHRQEIEALFTGEEVSWERLEGKIASRMAVYREYDKAKCAVAGPEREALFTWMTQHLVTCREVAKQYLV